MAKYFVYFNSLTGSREISINKRFSAVYCQTKLPSGQNFLTEIKDLLILLNQKMVDILYIFEEIDKNNMLNQSLQSLYKESEFVAESIKSIHISLFHEPFENVDPSLRVDNISLQQMLKLLKKIFVEFKVAHNDLIKMINIDEINRLLILIENSINTIIFDLEEENL